MAVRLISSAVGIVILVLVLMMNETFLFPAILGLINAIIIWELIKAVGADRFTLGAFGAVVYGFVSPFLQFYDNVLSHNENAITPIRQWEAFLFPFCLFLVFLEFIWHHKYFKVEQLGMMAGAMYLVTWSLGCLIRLKFIGSVHGMFYLVLALCGAWIADSGAYFTGVAIGKHKLCPNISPKKTIEGFVGGLLSNAFIFVVIFIIYTRVMRAQHYVMPDMDGIACLKVALLGLVCAGLSVVGDLTASVIKREKGIKDYGNIMPGHGGLMDRFDSVLFVVPAFYTFVSLFPIF